MSLLFGCYSDDGSETALREQTGPAITAASIPVPVMLSPLGLSHEGWADICHQYSSETAAAILVGLAALVLCCTKVNLAICRPVAQDKRSVLLWTVQTWSS